MNQILIPESISPLINETLRKSLFLMNNALVANKLLEVKQISYWIYETIESFTEPE